MDSYQKNSHLFFQCSVEDAQEKHKFFEEDIAAHTVNIQETCVVEIPIDKFDFAGPHFKWVVTHPWQQKSHTLFSCKMKQVLNPLMAQKSFGN